MKMLPTLGSKSKLYKYYLLWIVFRTEVRRLKVKLYLPWLALCLRGASLSVSSFFLFFTTLFIWWSALGYS